MKDDDFCQMLLYSLINLICFLLTVIFLTSLYNVRSQLKLLRIDIWSKYNSDLEMYQNSYTATATLFAFNFLGFVGFMGVLLLLIKKIKVNRTDNEANNMREININQMNGDVRTDERMGNTEQDKPPLRRRMRSGGFDVRFPGLQSCGSGSRARYSSARATSSSVLRNWALEGVWSSGWISSSLPAA
jgi:hypothetical protein